MNGHQMMLKYMYAQSVVRKDLIVVFLAQTLYVFSVKRKKIKMMSKMLLELY